MTMVDNTVEAIEMTKDAIEMTKDTIEAAKTSGGVLTKVKDAICGIDKRVLIGGGVVIGAAGAGFIGYKIYKKHHPSDESGEAADGKAKEKTPFKFKNPFKKVKSEEPEKEAEVEVIEVEAKEVKE